MDLFTIVGCMHQRIFIIGATGKVGSTLTRQIYQKGDIDASLHVNPTRVVGLASSSSLVFSRKGIPQKTAFNFLKTKKGHSSYNNLTELITLVRKNCDNLVLWMSLH